MKFWVDAQLSPYLAEWISQEFNVTCKAVREIDLRDANDTIIFTKALENNAIVITKDSDFAHLAQQKSRAPQILWITVGNTSNQNMKEILEDTFTTAIEWFEAGEELVEITEDSSVEEID